MSEHTEEVMEFSAESVEQALAAAREHNQSTGLEAVEGQLNLATSGEFEVLAQCVSVTVANRRICLNLPLGLGHVCLPIPISTPSGTAAKACLTICTKFGIPSGVKVSVSVAGQTIVSKKFGFC